MNTYTFLFTSLIIILIPGTGVVYTISAGIIKGRKAGIVAALGCTAGILPHLCVSITLSSFLVRMSNEAFLILKILGVFYLVYLGAGMLLSKNGFELKHSQLEDKPVAMMIRAVLINVLNPKLTLFFFSFLPQYVSTSSKNYAMESLFYGVTFMLLTLIVFIGYGVLAGTAKRFLIGFPKRMNTIQRIFGLVFIVFAIQLSLSAI